MFQANQDDTEGLQAEIEASCSLHTLHGSCSDTVHILRRKQRDKFNHLLRPRMARSSNIRVR